jgi:hypothetical protein
MNMEALGLDWYPAFPEFSAGLLLALSDCSSDLVLFDGWNKYLVIKFS